MAGTTFSDWDLIFILITFSVVSSVGFYYYVQDFKNNALQNNLSYSDFQENISEVNISKIEGLVFLKNLKIQTISEIPNSINYIVGTIMVAFLSILIYRLIRHGGG